MPSSRPPCPSPFRAEIHPGEVPITDCSATGKPAIRRWCPGGVGRGPLVPVVLASFHLALLPALCSAGRRPPARFPGADSAPPRLDAGPAPALATRRLVVGGHAPGPARRGATWGADCQPSEPVAGKPAFLICIGGTVDCRGGPSYRRVGWARGPRAEGRDRLRRLCRSPRRPRLLELVCLPKRIQPLDQGRCRHRLAASGSGDHCRLFRPGTNPGLPSARRHPASLRGFPVLDRHSRLPALAGLRSAADVRLSRRRYAAASYSPGRRSPSPDCCFRSRRSALTAGS